MAEIEKGKDDFMLRAMDAVSDAQHRQMEKFDPKKLRQVVAKLKAVKEERRAAIALRQAQKEQYEVVFEEVKSHLAAISKDAMLDMPDNIRILLENTERKLRKSREEALRQAEEEQYLPEPD